MCAVTTKPQDLELNLHPPRRLGELLLKAELISKGQVAVAVHDQAHYADMLIGEILALRGWLKQETADFFVEQWPNLLRQSYRLWLGDYFKAAALLSTEQIDHICCEQRQTGLRFGSAAVLLGLMKQPTLDFFLVHLFPEEQLAGTLMNNRSAVLKKKEMIQPSPSPELATKVTLAQSKTTRIQPPEEDEIQWIG
jgi:hypothetical protein